VLECPDKLTDKQVSIDMGTRDHATNTFDNFSHTQESLVEAFEEIDSELAPDIIAEHDPSLTGTSGKSEGECIIHVHKPDTGGLAIYIAQTMTGAYASPFCKSTIP
jgi:hypothetical protein